MEVDLDADNLGDLMQILGGIDKAEYAARLRAAARLVDAGEGVGDEDDSTSAGTGPIAAEVAATAMGLLSPEAAVAEHSIAETAAHLGARADDGADSLALLAGKGHGRDRSAPYATA